MCACKRVCVHACAFVRASVGVGVRAWQHVYVCAMHSLTTSFSNLQWLNALHCPSLQMQL